MKYNDLTMYLVGGGEIVLADSQDCDGIESVVVLAIDEADAIRIADLYDQGELEHGNFPYHSETVAAVTDHDGC